MRFAAGSMAWRRSCWRATGSFSICVPAASVKGAAFSGGRERRRWHRLAPCQRRRYQHQEQVWHASVVRSGAKLGYKDLFVWFVENGVDLKAVDQDAQGLVQYLEEFGHSKMIPFVQQFDA
jgi:hypothetical protein